MPRGNPGIKRENVQHSEEQIAAIKDYQRLKVERIQQEWKLIKESNQMECNTCSLTKSLEFFSPRTYIDGSKVYCKQCKVCQASHKKNKYKERSENETAGFDYTIKEILRYSQQRAKKYNREFDLDAPFIKQLYDDQKGYCIYSGRKLVLTIGSLDRISIDRKDSSIGYIKTNVVLCTTSINIMKNDRSVDVFMEWVKSMNEHSNEWATLTQ